MKEILRRWLGAAGTSALLCGLLATGTGCGAIKAAANPKVAWALNDPAPMSVVVRRADVAEKTAENVDRLMTETPAEEASPWLGKVAPETQTATEQLVELRKHDLYASGLKIVAAEVWAKSLASVESKSKPAKDAKPAKAEKKLEPAKTEAKAEPEPAKTEEPSDESTLRPGKKGNKGKKPAANKTAKNDKGAEKKSSKKAAPESASQDAVGTTTTTSAPVSADAAADASSSKSKYTSLLAAIDKDLGDEWSKVMEKKKAIGELKGQIAVLESANDQKNVTEADKNANKAKIKELDKQIDALDAEAKKLSKEFIPKAKAAAQKTAAPMRDKIGPVLVNLRQAVADANVSNGAAALRYPLAATTLLDSAQQMVLVYIGDVVEEKTGKRPSTQGLQPGVTLDGGKVNVTINGLDKTDMGKINAGELTSEVSARTARWVKRAFGLMGVISANKEILDFEDEVLGALLDGFKAAGYTAPAAATIPEAPAAAAAQPRS